LAQKTTIVIYRKTIYVTDDTDSYLRKFEQEVSKAFHVEDGVFMPSGVMAQNIALLIHSKQKQQQQQQDLKSQQDVTFACHHTSHLLLHEHDAFTHLLQMKKPLIISTANEYDKTNGIHVPSARFEDVMHTFESLEQQGEDNDDATKVISTLILELPHREIGGKCTPWDDVLQIKQFLKDQNIAFHCDGARLVEAAAGYGLSLPEVAQPFDSIYISFYKGLDSIAGAMLLGNKDFCDEARIWLRRFGGNLCTLLPYAVSSWDGYRKHTLVDDDDDMTSTTKIVSFQEKQRKLTRIVQQLSSDAVVKKYIAFDPPTPETNMLHVYLKASKEHCEKARDETMIQTNIRVFHRIREVFSKGHPACDIGNFQCYLELTMGDGNVGLEDDVFLEGWKTFASCLSKLE